jgi:predicted NAD-dependent protein-ADP-ribosyltransferase YbiA (DUF1768 family)
MLFIFVFNFSGHCFPTSTHCYLYQKALFHGNKQLAERVLEETDVDELRRMMTPIKVTHHQAEQWNKMQVGVSTVCSLEFNLRKLTWLGNFW